MRTSRCILYTAVGTVLSLLYVFQQTEVVKLGYKITAAESVLEAASDRKTALEYSLSSAESPFSLDKNLFLKEDSFEMAGKFRLVKVVSPKTLESRVRVASLPSVSGAARLKRLAYAILSAGKQAEAKTVK